MKQSKETLLPLQSDFIELVSQLGTRYNIKAMVMRHVSDFLHGAAMVK